jgi:hypothetical protein
LAKTVVLYEGGRPISHTYENGPPARRPSCADFGRSPRSSTPPGVATNGHAPTLDEAKAKFRDNWTNNKAKGGAMAPLPEVEGAPNVRKRFPQ